MARHCRARDPMTFLSFIYLFLLELGIRLCETENVLGIIHLHDKLRGKFAWIQIIISSGLEAASQKG